jgi:hypothetical protein
MTVAPAPLHRNHPRRRAYVTLLAALVLAVAGVLLLARHDVDGDSSSSGIRGSGTAATETRELAAFDGVELAGSNVVTIRVGPPQTVVVHADDNLLPLVTTEVSGGSLVIGTTGSVATRSPMSVDVTVPSLESLTLSGSGIVAVEGIGADRFVVTLPGSGVLRATGQARRLDVSLGGSGDAQLEQLVAREVHAAVDGSGRIAVHATNTLDASVAGSGAIMYIGDPVRVTTSVTGSGAIVRQ